MLSFAKIDPGKRSQNATASVQRLNAMIRCLCPFFHHFLNPCSAAVTKLLYRALYTVIMNAKQKKEIEAKWQKLVDGRDAKSFVKSEGLPAGTSVIRRRKGQVIPIKGSLKI